MARILMVLPANNFDPTESSVPWWKLHKAGHEVAFSTPDGSAGRADPRMLTGAGLGPWSKMLRATREASHLYERMTQDSNFLKPTPYAQSVLHLASLIFSWWISKAMRVRPSKFMFSAAGQFCELTPLHAPLSIIKTIRSQGGLYV